jgi:hypothetical protein
VKNITAHYRSCWTHHFGFTPDPNQNFNREFTDYFVNGRKDDIGAFDSPKNPGQPIGFVLQRGPQLGRAGRLTDRQPCCTTATACVTTTCKKSWPAWPSTAPKAVNAAKRAAGACSPRTPGRPQRPAQGRGGQPQPRCGLAARAGQNIQHPAATAASQSPRQCRPLLEQHIGKLGATIFIAIR